MDKAAEIVTSLRAGKELHEEYKTKLTELYKLEGKTIKQWEQELSLDIPEDATLAQVRILLSAINRKLEAASRLQASNDLYHSVLETVIGSVFKEAMKNTVTELKGEGQKLPAKDILITLAEEKVKDYHEALLHSSVAKNFFKIMYAKLCSQLSILKNMIIAYGIEVKVTPYGGDDA